MVTKFTDLFGHPVTSITPDFDKKISIKKNAVFAFTVFHHAPRSG
jgi:hypothetical protein